MIIDCHCHAGKGDGLTGPWDTRAPLKAYLAQAKACGIEKINLFAAFHSDYAKANREVGQIVKKNPRLFFGFAFVHANRDRGRVFKMVAEGLRKFGFRGIKVHRHDARISREICEVAQALQMPVLYDPMGEVSTVELIAQEYPGVNFIIPHLGSFADDWKAQLAFVPMLKKYRNVYTDTSGVRRFDLLQAALAEGGAGKILFGSDGPWLHPAVELEKVYQLSLSAREEAQVLGKNFLKLIKNVRRSAPPLSANASLRKPPPPPSAGSTKRSDPWILNESDYFSNS